MEEKGNTRKLLLKTSKLTHFSRVLKDTSGVPAFTFFVVLFLTFSPIAKCSIKYLEKAFCSYILSPGRSQLQNCTLNVSATILSPYSI